MKRHTEEKYVDTEHMTDQQVLLQYFRNFDLDKNGYLDGLEVLKALIKQEHEHEHDDHDEPKAPSAPAEEDDEKMDIMDFVDIVDEELKLYDLNDDGYVTYPEFMQRHNKQKHGEGGGGGLI